MPSQLPEVPPQPIGPVDEVQMTNIVQRAFVRAPATTSHTDQPIIRSFLSLDNLVAFPEYTRQRRPQRSTIRVVLHSLNIRSTRVEGFGHILHGQLFEGTGLETEIFEHFVDFWDIGHANPGEEVVCKG